MDSERERQRIDLLRVRQKDAKEKVKSLAQAIRDVMANTVLEPIAPRTLGGLASQFDEAVTKYQVYTQELFEATT